MKRPVSKEACFWAMAACYLSEWRGILIPLEVSKFFSPHGGLPPGVLPEAPLASKASAKQKTYPHGDFDDHNYIGGARSGR